MNDTRSRGFTIIELLVVVSIIAVLIGLLLPAVARARYQANVMTSQSNTRQITIGYQTYGADHQDNQAAQLPHDISTYGSSRTEATNTYESVNGVELPCTNLGWYWDAGFGQETGSMASFCPGYPMFFSIESGSVSSGMFRYVNLEMLNKYLSGRWADPVYYAPNDRGWNATLFEENIYGAGGPSEFVNIWSSYCFAPSAHYAPTVFGHKNGFVNPWDVPAGHRPPTFSQAQFPELKTLLCEYYWLQNQATECNGNYNPSPGLCIGYLFNHGQESTPVVAFYDGHVSMVGVPDAEQADARNRQLAGFDLWSRDTPAGEDGFLISLGYDFSETSFHILTTDGIKGRDFLK